MNEHKCEGKIFRGRGFDFNACGKNAVREHEGHWFCKTHHPPTIAAKNDAKVALWVAERNAKNSAIKAQSAALAEQKRRADCYPDLLAALEYALDFLQDWEDSDGGPYARKARAAIAKATGDRP